MQTEEKFKVILHLVDREAESFHNVTNFDIDFDGSLFIACSSGNTYFYNSQYVRSVDVIKNP